MTAAPLGADGPPRVGFAVGRAVGNAVVRNRVRRRLRAAVHARGALLRPGWGYLVRASGPAGTSTYKELDVTLGELLHAHRGSGDATVT